MLLKPIKQMNKKLESKKEKEMTLLSMYAKEAKRDRINRLRGEFND